jgi:phosphate:Na+ symporter
MGANIGTTITGWILVLKVGAYGLPLAGAAAFVYLFAKRDRWRYTALAFMGLGMIFLGLELMKDGFGVIKELPEFEAWFQTFEANSYFGVLKCALVGCVVTLVVQSSSATLGITIGLAQIGVIEFETAAALVLGENIGTTITAWLASFGSNTNAKRAAYFHVLFNTLGVAWITAVFPWYLMFIRYFITGDFNGDMSLEHVSPAQITAGIAATHTGFNVTNTIVFLPLVGVMTSFLQRFIPERAANGKKTHLTNLDIRMLESPAIAIERSRVEVMRMSDDCRRMMEELRQVLTSDILDEDRMKIILRLEDDQDTVQHEIVTFLADLLAANVPHKVIDEARRQLRMADEFESVSDCIATVLKSHRRLYRAESRMPEAEMTAILELHDMVGAYLTFVSKSCEQRSQQTFHDAIAQGESITKHAKALVKQVLAKIPDEKLVPPITLAFNRQVSAYRRVRDHLVNVAEALIGEK